MSSFRDKIRELAQGKADHATFLALSDKLRDQDLVELGVALDDREDGKALIKLVDKETLIRQREEKAEREAQKLLEKERRKKEQQAKKMEKLAKGKTPPGEMFKDEEGLKAFSQWDEKGIPTHAADGSELPKSRRKKLIKEFDVQAKLHEEYKAFVAENGEF
ncbi:hypothetical protein HK102_005414 [Quaeritorhiza haematococci]|nr:hypothetical protein HK102_005414 [Quaeritorhiza haematococci]